MDAAAHIQLLLPDADERGACFRLLDVEPGRVVRSFASADDWIDSDRRGGVLLFHWDQPGRVCGRTLLRLLRGRDDIVAIVAAAALDIAESRAILRGGAFDVLAAPLEPRAVQRSVARALAHWSARRREQAAHREAAARFAALTRRERHILDAIATGLGNKAIARQLGLSPRTVEVHRASIMRRAGARNVAELLRLRFTADPPGFAAGDRVRSGPNALSGAAGSAGGPL